MLSGGASIIAPRGSFTDDVTGRVSRLRDRNYIAPAIYYRQSLPGRAAFGVGLFAPYGLTTDWPSDSQGRFLGYKSLVQSIYAQPTVAFRLHERVAVGAGLDITYLHVQLRRRVDLSTQPLPGAPNLTFASIGVPAGTDFADLNLTGNETHFGFHVGVLVKPHERVSFGARFLSGQKVDVSDGTLETQQVRTGLVTRVPLPGIPAGTPLDSLIAPAFVQGAPLGPTRRASATLPLPAQFVAGVAVNVTEALRLLAQPHEHLDSIEIAARNLQQVRQHEPFLKSLPPWLTATLVQRPAPLVVDECLKSLMLRHVLTSSSVHARWPPAGPSDLPHIVLLSPATGMVKLV